MESAGIDERDMSEDAEQPEEHGMDYETLRQLLEEHRTKAHEIQQRIQEHESHRRHKRRVSYVESATLDLSFLPCFDEKDDGVPPCCRGPPRWWKLFNKSHPITNHNVVMYAFGNVGYRKFDKERRFWMGLVTLSTLLSIFVTVYGALALSSSKSLVMNSRWFTMRYNNITSGEDFEAFIGLRSLVQEHEPCTVLGCKTDVYLYAFTDMNEWPDQLVAHHLEDCRKEMYGNAFGAFLTCFTLIFALIGTVNRMKRSSDANVQKLLGMTTDLFGAVMQGLTMLIVHKACVLDVESKGSGYGMHLTNVSTGPGFHAYLFCFFTACLRAICHWITPTPGRGAGCKCMVPQDLKRIVNENMDSPVSWQDFKRALANGTLSSAILQYEQKRASEITRFEWERMTSVGRWSEELLDVRLTGSLSSAPFRGTRSATGPESVQVRQPGGPSRSPGSNPLAAEVELRHSQSQAGTQIRKPKPRAQNAGGTGAGVQTLASEMQCAVADNKKKKLGSL